MRILVLVERSQWTTPTPYRVQANVGEMIPIIAAIGAHRIITIMSIIVHEVVCGHSYDPSEEVTTFPFRAHIILNDRDIIVNRIICVNGEAR